MPCVVCVQVNSTQVNSTQVMVSLVNEVNRRCLALASDIDLKADDMRYTAFVSTVEIDPEVRTSSINIVAGLIAAPTIPVDGSITDAGAVYLLRKWLIGQKTNFGMIRNLRSLLGSSWMHVVDGLRLVCTAAMDATYASLCADEGEVFAAMAQALSKL